MEKKRVIDRRQVKLETLMRSDYIPMGAGRPDRQRVIGEDDVRNLVIALNTSGTLEELLAAV